MKADVLQLVQITEVTLCMEFLKILYSNRKFTRDHRIYIHIHFIFRSSLLCTKIEIVFRYSSMSKIGIDSSVSPFPVCNAKESLRVHDRTEQYQLLLMQYLLF